MPFVDPSPAKNKEHGESADTASQWLAVLTDDTTDARQMEAIRALVGLASTDVIPRLLETALSGGSRRACSLAAKTLGQLAAKIGPDDTARLIVDPVLQRAKGRNAETQVPALAALSDLGLELEDRRCAELTVEGLFAALRSTWPDVSCSAVQELQQIAIWHPDTDLQQRITRELIANLRTYPKTRSS